MATSKEPQPLVTFALFAYNQERFIQEAVNGALAQTYSPLEIIISDDQSDDATYELIKSSVQAYSGRHTVILNQNDTNLGVADHINTVMRLARGELVVLAAGDDISMPERTGVIVDRWLSEDRPKAMCSNFISIDDQGASHGDPTAWYRQFMPKAGETRGEILERLVRSGVPALIGCTEAWSAELFSLFPSLRSDVWFEDNALSFRAWLTGEIHYLPEQLVAYRQHETNISNRVPETITTNKSLVDLENQKSIWYARRRAVLAMHQCDLDVAYEIGTVSAQKHAQLSALIAQEGAVLEIRADWWNGGGLSRIVKASRVLRKDFSVPSLRWVLPRLLPLQWFARLQVWRHS